ncbi:MAG: hypothetical protein C0507_21975 [Cyanobacteria bacterium PR.3.49]|nr:hypothetical protein [Cyanobacteria bacterium PR.3.49]
MIEYTQDVSLPAQRLMADTNAEPQDRLRMQADQLLTTAGSSTKAAGAELSSIQESIIAKTEAPGQAETARRLAEAWREQIENRIASGELSRQEVADTMKHAQRLISNDSKFLTRDQRGNVAAGILYHMGHGRIDQGMHATCNVTVLQNIAFMDKPSIAAEMITSAALEGKWTAPDGKVITIPEDSMTPGMEESVFPPVDGLRTHASQIFQVVALNDVGQREKEPKEFVQKPAGPASMFHTLASHLLPASEYWMPNGYEVWRDSSAKETAFMGLTGKQIQEESQRLFGDKYETISYRSPWESWKYPFSSKAEDYKLTKMVESEDGLRTTISDLDKSGKLPVVVAVDGDNVLLSSTGVIDNIIYGLRSSFRPLRTASEFIDSQLGIANHVVTVTKYDAASDRVFIENSWGKDQDGWMSVRDLWKAV